MQLRYEASSDLCERGGGGFGTLVHEALSY
jgi:hypothetical protein